LISASTGLEGSYGTGFFFQTNGYIATNYHVVKNATNISVHLYDGTVKDAELVGYVETDDIAVLKIEGKNYPAVAFGDSDALTVGEVAIAIGNPGGDDGEWSTTQGIISKCHRVVTVEERKYVADLNIIQMDTPVNPGNSGGPLCNANGEVIGIITRKMTDFEGIGYAIPINEARDTIDAIMEGREDSFTSTVSKVRPKLGILVTDVRKGTQFQVGGRYYTAMQDGVAVSEVYVDSYITRLSVVSYCNMSPLSFIGILREVYVLLHTLLLCTVTEGNYKPLILGIEKNIEALIFTVYTACIGNKGKLIS
jgi:S1-C subfamily serine protease